MNRDTCSAEYWQMWMINDCHTSCCHKTMILHKIQIFFTENCKQQTRVIWMMTKKLNESNFSWVKNRVMKNCQMSSWLLIKCCKDELKCRQLCRIEIKVSVQSEQRISDERKDEEVIHQCRKCHIIIIAVKRISIINRMNMTVQQHISENTDFYLLFR